MKRPGTTKPLPPNPTQSGETERAMEVAAKLSKADMKRLRHAIEAGGRTHANHDANLHFHECVDFWGWPTPLGRLVARSLKGEG